MGIFDWLKRKSASISEEDSPMTDEDPPAKRLTEELWVKLVDLPGFREWAEEYDRLERVIPELEEYHLLVHPRDIENPPHGYFERVFQR
jgi:hypothetical protein